MVLYPDAQQQAQAELDAHLEKDRLPDFNDRKFLPYVDAVVKETLRWQPVAPLGKYFDSRGPRLRLTTSLFSKGSLIKLSRTTNSVEHMFQKALLSLPISGVLPSTSE